MNRLQKSGLIYLYLLPPVVAAVGFGIGHVSCLVYIPLWAVNVCLILLAVRQLIKRAPNTTDFKLDGWTNAGLLLITPWILFSIFAGMGPPPDTMVNWLATSTEQQIRYTILIFGGIVALMGFALLKRELQNRGEQIYSILGFTILGVAIPLFVLNMAFWGYYLTSAFRFFVTLPVGKRPDWYPPVKMLFYVISVVEVALIYFATMLFAIALRKAHILSTGASNWYIGISIIGIVLVVLPPSLPEPLSTAGYLAAIPAIPFIMPYLMGVRLLLLKKHQID
jgi:mannose/fructose/N-acetylgalactosamine-specific phosphotransferase system component IIC